MNKERRKKINQLISQLADLKEQIEAVQEEEQEYYDNMPAGIQEGEKGSKAEDNISNIEDAANSLDQAIDSLQTAIE